ncbi:cobaltochelatase subunit CobN [uncultured Tepidimonas sp.]|uniref:cobaltochelatase subunit CobN n=1 Tax=uncultured Tepidimonas sp. TaxID=453579 RepID=UPI0026296C7A|nr:cobaltochelatase subunit CobN [uncultured Tepidimonas sp.]
MHVLAARPGGFVDDGAAGVVRVSQSPGDIVVLSAADTTLSLLAEAVQALPETAPRVRLTNLMALRQPASVDWYIDDVLSHARAIVIDHLGAAADWAYLVERVTAMAQRQGQWVALFSGDMQEDAQLLLRSSAGVADSRLLWRYLREGGRVNAQRFFATILHRVWGIGLPPDPPEPMPEVFPYQPATALPRVDTQAPTALLVLYRAHVLAGNTGVFDRLMQALAERGLQVRAWAVDSLKSCAAQSALRAAFAAQPVDIVLNTTAFAAGGGDGDGDETCPWWGDAPVLQLITAGSSRERWAQDPHGLSPRDQAMHVVLPEVDGRIITRAISFKGTGWRCERAEVDVARYEAAFDRIDFVAELARRWCRLRRQPPHRLRLAFILANYPCDDARIGHAVGLDTPASLLAILDALREQGVDVGDLPADGQRLMALLQQSVTHSLEANPMRPAVQSLALQDYERSLSSLPAALRAQVDALWGPPQCDPMVRQGRIMIPGLRLGRVFVGIQPPRGRDIDLVRTYHDADLVPPHAYLAFYVWLREHWQADAIVHVGKHGNLEWLPGKSVALGQGCWPDWVLGPMPHLYPFIVNDPGEGCQAKRRTQAVIVDHLMPPLTRAETYGLLQAIERTMDEYYEALLLDPRRAQRLRERILDDVLQHQLHRDLGFETPADEGQRVALLQRLDAYLCDIKESQIRQGLHIFGRSPEGPARLETLMALVRFPRGSGMAQDSLLRALAADLGLEGYDPLQAEAAAPWQGPRPAPLVAVHDGPWRHHGHTRERLERLALQALAEPCRFDPAQWPRTCAVLSDVLDRVVPRLDACGRQEMTQLLSGLRGRFVPPGPSGAPSRGRIDVLPTGRNFYAVDTRAVPTPTAWAMGMQAAQRLIERHLQDHGTYPQSVGMSVWGTSTMRTGGEDFAQALALLGVRPRWAEGSGRVVDIEVLPMSITQRPRIDVTLRISGFFRDAFPALIDLFDVAVQAVAAIPPEDEPDEVNPIRVRVQREAGLARAHGEDSREAWRRATWRVFGPRLGDYGNGIQERIQSGRWRARDELAQAFVNASAYAYGQGQHGAPAHHSFMQRMAAVDVVVHNQDNREHDILDSDGYYPFLGGMAAASTWLRGQAPAIYHGDASVPGAPRIRTLAEELARVVRARAVNPKWVAAMRQHGYRGAAEMASTVDLLFGFGATTGLVADHQYALMADTYVLDPVNQAFLQQVNPQALRSLGLRLLEAIQRGLWRDGGAYAERLREALLWLDDAMENNPSVNPL